MLFDPARQALLVGTLDGGKACQQGGVVSVGAQAGQLAEIPSPAVAETLIEQGGEAAISAHQPAPWRDAIGHVDKFGVTIEIHKVLEQLLKE